MKKSFNYCSNKNNNKKNLNNIQFVKFVIGACYHRNPALPGYENDHFLKTLTLVLFNSIQRKKRKKKKKNF